jgi:DNA repair protein RadC
MKLFNPYRHNAAEVRAVMLRDCPEGIMTEREATICDNPEPAARYWDEVITAAPWYDPDKEALVVLMLNTRRRITSHALVGIGCLDSVNAHAREIFRPAIAAAAHAIILMHNHPSGDPNPSENDKRITLEMVRAGKLLKIEVLDHVITSRELLPGRIRRWVSLRELGLCFSAA